MGFLSDEDRKVLEERFSKELSGAVFLTVFSEPVSSLYVPGRRTCLTCKDAEDLATEVAAISDLIQVEVVNVREQAERAVQAEITWTPTIAIAPQEEPAPRVRFLGFPAGFEFMSFIETIVSASSGNGFGLRAESLEQIGSLDRDLEIMTFVTPT